MIDKDLFTIVSVQDLLSTLSLFFNLILCATIFSMNIYRCCVQKVLTSNGALIMLGTLCMISSYLYMIFSGALFDPQKYYEVSQVYLRSSITVILTPLLIKIYYIIIYGKE